MGPSQSLSPRHWAHQRDGVHGPKEEEPKLHTGSDTDSG